MLVTERSIQQVAEHASMIPTREARSLCKLTRAQWQRIRKSPGCPEPVIDGRTATYRPDLLARHLRAFNERQQAQSLAQLHGTLGVSRRTIDTWTKMDGFPEPLGKRHGLDVFVVQHVKDFQLQITGGYEWHRRRAPSAAARRRAAPKRQRKQAAASGGPAR
jgi:hypothetical protein